MARQSTDIFARVIPFIGLGITVVLIFIALIFFSAILFWGGVIGAVLFLITYLKARFFPSKKQPIIKPTQKGRTYDQDDL